MRFAKRLTSLVAAAILIAPLAAVGDVSDDFRSLAGWRSPYHSSGSYSKQGVRLASNTRLADGVLTIHARPTPSRVTVGGVTVPAGGWTAGGIMHNTVIRPGSRLTVELRLNRSVGTRAAALLWPHQTPWPRGGELDFVENGADNPTRQSTAITNHWAGPDGRNAQKVIKFGPHDFTQWTNVEVIWTWGRFVVNIAGRRAAVYTEHVPTTPMKFAVQTAIAGGGHGSTFKGVPRTPGLISIRRLRIYSP